MYNSTLNDNGVYSTSIYETIDAEVVAEIAKVKAENPNKPDNVNSVTAINNVLKKYISFSGSGVVDTWRIGAYSWAGNNVRNWYLQDESTNSISFNIIVTQQANTYLMQVQLRPKNYYEFLKNRDKVQSNELASAAELLGLTGDADTRINSVQLGDLLDLTTPRTKGVTHNTETAYGDVVEKLNRIYQFPKFGSYEIYVHETTSKDHLAGVAKVRFGIKKDGVQVGKTSREVDFPVFKPMNYFDVPKKNPSSAWYTEADFTGSEFSKPSTDEQSKMNAINSTNFVARKVSTAVANKNFTNWYRVLDANDIVDQGAFEKINFMIGFKGQVAKEEDSQNGNFKNVETNDEEANSAPLPPTIPTDDGTFTNLGDQENTTNLNQLSKDWFIYFVDVQKEKTNRRINVYDKLSFKLGFINKRIPTTRFITQGRITLANVVNDYKLNMYPTYMLNSLGLSNIQNFQDFFGDEFNIQSYTAEQVYNTFISNNKTTSVSLRPNLSNKATSPNGGSSYWIYNNYLFSTTNNNLKIKEMKYFSEDPNGVYVQLEYTDKRNVKFEGNNWYRFSKSGTGAPADLNFLFNGSNKLTFNNENLKTVHLERNKVYRERIIEPKLEDTTWDFDENTQQLSWTLKNDYINKTVLKENTTNRKLTMQFFGYTYYKLLPNSWKRITEQGITFNFDLEKVLSGQTDTFKGSIEGVNTSGSYKTPTISYTATATKTADGIKFTFDLDDKSNKLKYGDLYKYQLNPTLESSYSGEFSKDKAFLVAKNAAKITLKYINNVEHEEFGSKTNEFLYKNMLYNGHNQPYVMYNDKVAQDAFGYNPNQNVSYELHNGYMLDNNTLSTVNNQTQQEQNVWMRAIALSFGSGTIWGRLSKDPNNHKFLIGTNNHVEAVTGSMEALKAWNGDVKPLAGEKYIVKPGDNLGNDVTAGFGYWNGLYRLPADFYPIWTGVNQKNVEGVRLRQNNGVDVDTSVLAIDLKDLAKKARRAAKFQTAEHYEKLATMPDLPLLDDKINGITNSSPYYFNGAMIGFPYGVQASYFINRARIDDTGVGLNTQNGFLATTFNSGNSGSGLQMGQNGYAEIINSGSPRTYLRGWKYNTGSVNYWGVNKPGVDPLSLKNDNSLAGVLYYNSVTNPNEFSAPTFINLINNTSEEEQQ
ncbi:MGA_1079 family surface serine endopeptidase [Mycoplasma nasistruthionis]|uniref:Uncharacterized protein n=1 Tax=Mycoplasma nasistruthionis TaxID=353852 RepID=A0A4Y6I705_9MOLU|nr:hypothetical protein [Mycoplasma nasistruthionis]QDF65172.1 hypothetical protein FIV53_02650 [Mycoplasma nasistruthionis]